MDWSTVTDVRDDATPPTRIPMITRPARVQMIAKIRAEIERGDRSPYLSAEKKMHHYHTSSTSSSSTLSSSSSASPSSTKITYSNKQSEKVKLCPGSYPSRGHVTYLTSFSADCMRYQDKILSVCCHKAACHR